MNVRLIYIFDHFFHPSRCVNFSLTDTTHYLFILSGEKCKNNFLKIFRDVIILPLKKFLKIFFALLLAPYLHGSHKKYRRQDQIRQAVFSQDLSS